MKHFNLCIIYSFVILLNDEIMTADLPCGDWEPYKDEKCIKILDLVASHEQASKSCSWLDVGSNLITIHSVEDQNFLTNLLYEKHKTVENVWIGAKLVNKQLKWEDKSNTTFTNWAAEYPKNENEYDCIQMIPEGTLIGKWVNVPCNKNNLIVCEKKQPLSLSQIRNIVVSLMKNPVPIGFIYVQLPGQPDPKSLWSIVEWKEVTSDYAGLFFRAEGGGSASFEQVQNENSPRLTNAKQNCDKTNFDSLNMEIRADGQWSPHLFTGGVSGDMCKIQFVVSNGEVRPRNKAIRIWKRIN